MRQDAYRSNNVGPSAVISKKDYVMGPKKGNVLHARSVEWLFSHCKFERNHFCQEPSKKQIVDILASLDNSWVKGV